MAKNYFFLNVVAWHLQKGLGAIKILRDKRDRRSLSYKFHGSFFLYIFHLQVIHERPWEKLFHKYKACIVSNFRILFFS